MNVTSHFLAITLKQRFFADLFVDLQIFFREKKIESCIELQNPLSLHITVYYLAQTLSIEESDTISNFLDTNRKKYQDMRIYINQFNFFKKDGIDHLGYLVPAPHEELPVLNQQCRSLLPNTVNNNMYEYTPHITLLTIKDTTLFHTHKSDINKIIQSHLKRIASINVFEGINLYAVNSRYSPQIQCIVSPSEFNQIPR